MFLTHHPYADHVIFRDGRYMQIEDLFQSVQYSPAKWQDKPLPGDGICGILTNLQVRTANTSGKTYAKGRIEDPQLSAGVIIWPNAYTKAREIIKENAAVVLKGKIQIPEVAEAGEDAWDGIEIVVEDVQPYDPDGARPTRELPESPSPTTAFPAMTRPSMPTTMKWCWKTTSVMLTTTASRTRPSSSLWRNVTG